MLALSFFFSVAPVWGMYNDISLCDVKRGINNFIGGMATKETTAVVIDALSLRTSTEICLAGTPAKNVVVVNNCSKVISKAKKKGHIFSSTGFSTEVLNRTPIGVDIVYLDYCGTPSGNKINGTFPGYDILLSADRLSKNGVLIVTFSAREPNAIRNSLDLVPCSMQCIYLFKYFNTSPMFVLVLSKKLNHKNYNKLKIYLCNNVPQCTNDNNLIRFYDKFPIKYSIIGFYCTHFCWFGIVLQVFNGNAKIFWIDPDDKESYGTEDGIWSINLHVDMRIESPKHEKCDGNWFYVHHSLEVTDNNVPISLNLIQYANVRKSVLESKQNKEFKNVYNIMY